MSIYIASDVMRVSGSYKKPEQTLIQTFTDSEDWWKTMC